MSSRFQKNKRDPESIAVPTGYEGENTTEDYFIPSCGLEDLDRAIFNLFDKDIPLYYMHANQQRKVPVIFATGERFAVLRRKEPLTDKNNAIILPLISIIRNSVENKPQKGMANNMMFPSVIAKRIAEEDTAWKQISNKENLLNSLYSPPKNKEISGVLSLQPKLTNNIVEVIEIPPPRYFGASYEVTIWSSFTQQMNAIMETIMSAYTLHPGQQFKVESEKGYWFPAFIDNSISQDASYQDFSDQERFVKYSFNITATGYIVAPNIMGGKTALRSFKSAPQISFDALIFDKEIDTQTPSGIPTGDPEDLILDDLRTVEEPLPGQAIGKASLAASDSRGIFRQRDASQVSNRDINGDYLGGATSDDNRTKIIEIENDPFTGKRVKKKLHVKTRTNRKGETVLREALK